MKWLYLSFVVIMMACTQAQDGIELPCHQVGTQRTKTTENVARFKMSTNDKVRVEYRTLDTILDLDSALHTHVFDLLEAGRNDLVRLQGIVYLDKHLPLEVHLQLKSEIRKSGIMYYSMMGCHDQMVDLYMNPVTDEDGYHDPFVIARLPPPPPPPPAMDTFLVLPSTVIARLDPGELVFEDPFGNRINDLSVHLRKYEQVMHFFRVVDGSTYDDHFLFYSVVISTLEKVRGSHENDSTARLARQRYPQRYWPYPLSQ